MTGELTGKEVEILQSAQLMGKQWFRPLDIGGTNNSNHSRLLARLVAKGLIERKHRSSHYSRPSYLYRVVSK